MKNIIVIISDEHRRDAMGCMGHDIVKTPHLDQLANDGTLFKRGYTASPMCVPTRAALATGTYVHQNRYWDSATPYDGQQISWMHMLRSQGYDTTSIGKLHFQAGVDHGFSKEIKPMHVHGKGWLVGLVRDELPDYQGAAELATEVGSGESSYTNYDLSITS
ncbi:MAG TPA: choline-sulfatase, partial [Alphaproteobacteria bacterium]|nr:choline-sulfatase [Alphaproteobacteria bacterium]